MVIWDKAVLAFGILSVLSVVVYSNHRANAASFPVTGVETEAVDDSPAPELPPGYLTNLATSPLAGLTKIALTPARPILRWQ